MIRSELLQKLAQDNPELRAQEVEQVVDDLVRDADLASEVAQRRHDLLARPGQDPASLERRLE